MNNADLPAMPVNGLTKNASGVFDGSVLIHNGMTKREMKTDKELLQLAARAGGVDVKGQTERGIATAMNGACMVCFWNPLEDDGDALRLAVDLDMDVCLSQKDKQVTAFTLSYGAVSSYTEPYGNDKHAATRCAIVRAAAAIGECME